LAKLRASQDVAQQLQQQLEEEQAAHQTTLSKLFTLQQQQEEPASLAHGAVLQAQSVAQTSALKLEVETLRGTVAEQRSKLMRLSKLLRSKVGAKKRP
jgi:hypothetical protein